MRAGVGNGGRVACLQVVLSSFLGVMGVVEAVVSSGMLERAPLGSSDFWRLAGAGTDNDVSACSSSPSADALRFLDSPVVAASVDVVVSVGWAELSSFVVYTGGRKPEELAYCLIQGLASTHL